MISYPQWAAPQAIDFTGNFGRGFQIGQGIRQDQRNSAGLDVLRNLNPMAAQSQQPQGGALSQIGMMFTPPNAPTSADPQTAMVNASHAAAAGAVDPSLATYFANARSAESGGNDLAKNPKSTATGRYQFLDSTWRGLMNQYPDLGLTADGRTDPAQQERAMARFTQDNARTLASNGLPVNPGSLYAAHFLGPAGASAVLGQDPNSQLSAYLQPGVAEANPHLNGMSVGDFINWSNSKGGNASGGYSGPSAALDAANSLGANGLPDVGAGQGQPFSLSGDQLAELMGSDMTRGFAQSYLQAEQQRQQSQGRFVMEQGPNGSVWQRDKLTGQTEVLMTPQQAGTGQTELGLTPQYGVDANGNPVLIQIGKDGQAVQTAMPEGVTLSKEPIRLDAGTHFVLLDPITRQPVGQIEKNNEEAAYQSGFGNAAGKAAAERIDSLPKVIAQADNMLSSIDGILNDPALDYSTGWLSWMQGVPGTEQYRFGQRALQLQGQAFLQAFESLKGGGQITEIEGAKATQAIGRLSTAQSADDYREALGELKGIINEAKGRAQQQAAPATSSPQAPQGAVTITNDAEYDALPPGTRFIGPDGQERIKRGL